MHDSIDFLCLALKNKLERFKNEKKTDRLTLSKYVIHIFLFVSVIKNANTSGPRYMQSFYLLKNGFFLGTYPLIYGCCRNSHEIRSCGQNALF